MTNNKLLVRELYYFLTVTLVLLIILELSWPGLILAYFNINLILIFWLIVGILLLITKE